MAKVKPSIVDWSLLHDVQMSVLGDLATTGLIAASGTPKSGFGAFKELRGSR
jgi:hypothetical protein